MRSSFAAPEALWCSIATDGRRILATGGKHGGAGDAGTAIAVRCWAQLWRGP